MKIAIDARYGLSGIGRFLFGILDNLDYDKNEFYLFGKEELLKKYSKAKIINTDLSPFSKKGLFDKAFKITKECDYFYSPNFIIPYTVKCKVYTTLHDIIFLDMPEVNSGFVDKSIKKFLLKRCMKKSINIYTVSNFSKERIGFHFPKYKDKVIAIYPGVSSSFYNEDIIENKDNYIIFVGNVKKNKGLRTLIEAFNMITKEGIDLKLYIVGDSKSFKNKDPYIDEYISNPNIVFTGYIGDIELKNLIKKAKFLIQPSLYEGFGLPPLESIYLGTKPIISDIDVFKEVYQNLPVEFFTVSDSKSLHDKILQASPNLGAINKEELNNKFSHKKYALKIEEKFL